MASTRNTSQRNHLLSLTSEFHFHREWVAANSPKQPVANSDSAAVTAARRDSTKVGLGERCACMRGSLSGVVACAQVGAGTKKKGPTGICTATVLVKMTYDGK